MAGIFRCIWDGSEVIDFDLDDFQLVMLLLEDKNETFQGIIDQLVAIGYDEAFAMKLLIKAGEELRDQKARDLYIEEQDVRSDDAVDPESKRNSHPGTRCCNACWTISGGG